MEQTHAALNRGDLLDRLIKGLFAAVLVAIAAFGAYYVTDRQLSSGADLPDRQIAQAEQVVRAQVDDASSRIALADLYADRGRLDEAIEQYRVALQANPDVWPAHRGLGLVALQRNQYASAAAEFQQVIDPLRNTEFAGSDKGLAEAYYFLAQAQLGLGASDAAVTDLQAALAIDRTDADAWEQLGETYLTIGQMDQAVEALRRAVDLAPRWPEAYAALRTAYARLGDSDGARYADAMRAYSTGDTTSAVRTLRELVQWRPDFGAAWTGLGLAYEAALQKDAAAAAYQQALAIDSSDMNARSGLTRVGPAPAPR